MKTVIAPREAEALMHEIAGLDARRSELDDAELEALEQQSTIDDELQSHLALGDGAARLRWSRPNRWRPRPRRRSTPSSPRSPSDTTVSEPGSMLQLLPRYDRLRVVNGVAAAPLNVHRCEGCHLDLSAAEVDEVRAEAVDGIGECPACGRMLVL